MPLSDEEQRRFDELVGSLEETEKKVEKVESRMRAKAGLYVVLFIVGLIGMIVGVATQFPIIGLAAFAAMMFGAYKFMPFLASVQGSQVFRDSNK